jgi:hypothetical protein
MIPAAMGLRAVGEAAHLEVDHRAEETVQ